MSEQKTTIRFEPVKGSPGLFECPWCFSAVTEPKKHIDYHERMLRNVQTASLGVPFIEAFFAPAADESADQTGDEA